MLCPRHQVVRESAHAFAQHLPTLGVQSGLRGLDVVPHGEVVVVLERNRHEAHAALASLRHGRVDVAGGATCCTPAPLLAFTAWAVRVRRRSETLSAKRRSAERRRSCRSC
jgi:hypothetical protein